MDDDPRGFQDEQGFIAVAAHPEPPAPPEPPRRTTCPEARRALAWAILGMMCLGFVFGPLALALGQRARLALAAEPELGDAGIAGVAVTMGKVGLALHLTLALTMLPWLLMPLVGIPGG